MAGACPMRARATVQRSSGRLPAGALREVHLAQLEEADSFSCRAGVQRGGLQQAREERRPHDALVLGKGVGEPIAAARDALRAIRSRSYPLGEMKLYVIDSTNPVPPGVRILLHGGQRPAKPSLHAGARGERRLDLIVAVDPGDSSTRSASPSTSRRNQGTDRHDATRVLVQLDSRSRGLLRSASSPPARDRAQHAVDPLRAARRVSRGRGRLAAASILPWRTSPPASSAMSSRPGRSPRPPGGGRGPFRTGGRPRSASQALRAVLRTLVGSKDADSKQDVVVSAVTSDLRAAHDAGDAPPGRSASQIRSIVAGERAHHAVEGHSVSPRRARRTTIGRPAAVEVEGVEGLAQFEHDVVGHVDHVVDGAHARRPQPLLHPGRRRADAHPLITRAM